MRRKSVFVISLLLALMLVGGVWAQDGTPEATPETTEAAATEAAAPRSTTLSYGTPVTGAISDTEFQQAWTLGTASADRVRVRVQRTTGNLIPDVSILDTSGTAIAQSYGSDYTYAAAEIDDFTLPAAGTYTIQVTRYNAQDGETKGGYTLEVTPLGTAEDNPNNQVVIGDVQYDTPVEGEITATHWRHVYMLTTEAADTINVVATRTSGTLTPVVTVLDANGSALYTGYNDGASAETGSFDLPAAGQYRVIVSRENDQDGATLGNYELTVRLSGSGEGNPLLQGAAGVVTYDLPLTGDITNARWYQDWQLTTTGADTITLNVARSGGDLLPEVVVLGGSGQELYHGYTDQTDAAAEISKYTLGGPGTYTVRVTRQSAQTGETSGAYTLTVTLDGAGESSPALNEPVGEVTLGEAVEGEVTNANWHNVWTFNAEAGGRIDVRVKRTDGTLSPLLAILDANGQPLTSAYVSSSRDSVEIVGYSLPAPGVYRIVVSRESDQDGATAGGYSLTVSAAAE